MRVAILTFDGFNELDSFIALGLLNRLKADGWKAEITSPSAQVTSMNGVTVTAQQPLEFANEADAVIFGSGVYTRAIAENSALLDRLQLDPLRQLIGAQCSGALLLARLGLLADMPACTDLTTKPWLIAAGVRVEDASFHARGPIATAGHMQTMMAFPGQVLMEYNQGERPVPYLSEFLECRNGKVWPNDRPGLGVR